MTKTTSKQANATVTEPAASVSALQQPAIRILKIGTCPSISGKSKLTYNIGVDPKGEIQIRIQANTGTGFFSDEWIPLSRVQGVIGKSANNKPMTSYVLHAMFQGKSVNTPAFLFAVLNYEGLIQPAKDKERCYERGDPKDFMAEVKALIASKVDLKVAEKTRKAKTVLPTAGTKAQAVNAKPQKAEAKSKQVVTGKKTPKKSTKSKKA